MRIELLIYALPVGLKGKPCMRKIFFTTLVFAMISLVSQRAEAVTYGESVLKPSKMFPSVVSVWFDNSKSGDPKKVSFSVQQH